MSFAEKQKEKIRKDLIKLYEGRIREISEETGYSEEYVRRHLVHFIEMERPSGNL